MDSKLANDASVMNRWCEGQIDGVGSLPTPEL